MTLDRSVLAFAGFMVLVSVALTAWVSPWFVWLTVGERLWDWTA